MKSIDIICNEITVLEAERDFGDITPERQEYLAVLELCYNLLTRTDVVNSVMVEQSEEMKEPGWEDDFIPKYGVSFSAIADFAFFAVTKKRKLDLRKMLFEIMRPHTAFSIAKEVGIRRQTIGDYFNGHKSMTCDNYERIINHVILK